MDLSIIVGPRMKEMYSLWGGAKVFGPSPLVCREAFPGVSSEASIGLRSVGLAFRWNVLPTRFCTVCAYGISAVFILGLFPNIALGRIPSTWDALPRKYS